MESNSAVIGALIFIAMVIGANIAMYAIARGASRSKSKSTLEMLGKALNTSTQKKDDSMDELHRRIQDLNEGKKDNDSADSK